MAKNNKSRRSGWKSYLLIVASISLLWLGNAMSDKQNYPVDYAVEWRGVDTARYVVVQADTTLQVMLRSNGFHALSRSMHRSYKHLVVPVDSVRQPYRHGDTVALSVNARNAVLASNQRHKLSGISEVHSDKEMLRLYLVERHSKKFMPRLDRVDYVFAPQYGLAGTPYLRPDSVVLYGSKASLDKINEVQALPATVANISKSGYHRIDLDPAAWQRYPDVHGGTAYVSLYIPVQQFTEKYFDLPLQVLGVDSTTRINLYPAQVRLAAWVPVGEFENLRARDFRATVRYDAADSDSVLAVRLEQYPGTVRVKNIVPNTVKYVVIK